MKNGPALLLSAGLLGGGCGSFVAAGIPGLFGFSFVGALVSLLALKMNGRLTTTGSNPKFASPKQSGQQQKKVKPSVNDVEYWQNMHKYDPSYAYRSENVWHESHKLQHDPTYSQLEGNIWHNN